MNTTKAHVLIFNGIHLEIARDLTYHLDMASRKLLEI